MKRILSFLSDMYTVRKLKLQARLFILSLGCSVSMIAAQQDPV